MDSKITETVFKHDFKNNITVIYEKDPETKQLKIVKSVRDYFGTKPTLCPNHAPDECNLFQLDTECELETNCNY